MVRLFKFALLLGLAGLIGLAGYALVADLPAPVETVTVPVPLPDGG
ncbi:MAG: hypothetical protein AAGC57_02775 [Pseudomonadota bacterium]